MYHPTRDSMYSDRQETEHLIQRITQLENQMNQLIKLIEHNNQILHSIEDEQNKDLYSWWWYCNCSNVKGIFREVLENTVLVSFLLFFNRRKNC